MLPAILVAMIAVSAVVLSWRTGPKIDPFDPARQRTERTSGGNPLPNTLSDYREGDALPILGNREVVDGETVYATIADFAFVNQNGDTITNETFAGRAYLVDFFFLSCPTICPKVTKQMLRLHDEFRDDDRVLLLAHTVDPKRDTPERLRQYADNLDVSADKWHFVTGDQDELYAIADDYFSIAIENPDAPGGFDHSGRIILVDAQGRVRSFANGTNAEEVTRLVADVRLLLEEMEG